jgi:hypothetical protein
MLRWKRNLSGILKDSKVEAAMLARIRAHDDNPQAWVVLDAFQKYFSHKNKGSESNFFIFKDKTTLNISREGIFWSPSESPDTELVLDCEYSTWYIAQRVGKTRWLQTFLSPFPDEE